MADSSEERNVNLARSVGKALSILEYVGQQGECGLTEIAANTGLPKSTLHRLISALVDGGFLRRTAYGHYRVSVKLWRIGASAVDYEAVRSSARLVLNDLVGKTSETAHYAVYEDGYAVYVEKIDGLHPIRSYTAVGGRSPSYASATGKALLAWRDASEIERIGRTAKRFTPTTHVGADLVAHMAEVCRVGYAINRGEWREGVWGIAAPIFGPTGEVVAAIGISGPEKRVRANLRAYAKTVCEAARSLSVFDQDRAIRKGRKA